MRILDSLENVSVNPMDLVTKFLSSKGLKVIKKARGRRYFGNNDVVFLIAGRTKHYLTLVTWLPVYEVARVLRGIESKIGPGKVYVDPLDFRKSVVRNIPGSKYSDRYYQASLISQIAVDLMTAPSPKDLMLVLTSIFPLIRKIPRRLSAIERMSNEMRNMAADLSQRVIGLLESDGAKVSGENNGLVREIEKAIENSSGELTVDHYLMSALLNHPVLRESAVFYTLTRPIVSFSRGDESYDYFVLSRAIMFDVGDPSLAGKIYHFFKKEADRKGVVADFRDTKIAFHLKNFLRLGEDIPNHDEDLLDLSNLIMLLMKELKKYESSSESSSSKFLKTPDTRKSRKL